MVLKSFINLLSNEVKKRPKSTLDSEAYCLQNKLQQIQTKTNIYDNHKTNIEINFNTNFNKLDFNGN